MVDRRKKVCVVVASRANLARITTVLEAVRDHPALELQVIAAASALLDRFGGAVNLLEEAGFRPDARIRFIIEGQTPAAMAKSTGLGLIELPTAFEMLEPDVVVTVADRFETIATAVAAAYMNIPVAHTQGGEVSGSIDESVRHAITKLSHIHFPATELSARRIVAMGEDPRFVFNVGCPSIDLAARTRPGTHRDVLSHHGGDGSPIDPQKPFVLVMQHGVTTEYGQGRAQMIATLRALSSIGMQALVFPPNVDAGSDDVATGIREIRALGLAERCHFVGNLPAEDFTRLMAHCACMIGNSSAALREGAYLGTPAVSVGTRQHSRECGPNVVFASHDPLEIAEAIRTQITHGRYESSHLFGDGTAGRRVADLLATVSPPVQKRLHYDSAELLRRSRETPRTPVRAPTQDDANVDPTDEQSRARQKPPHAPGSTRGNHQPRYETPRAP
ncbi:UDP-N-acetylglucosamine 2-epimerase [Embleya sp. NPDC005971]|uniref:UDP-N-acetylglucosamine 2-epimerase n=1 Tax=Embleya sp. NPDC005971 TaxID=3156724 RepID=UPI0033FD8BBF